MKMTAPLALISPMNLNLSFNATYAMFETEDTSGTDVRTADAAKANGADATQMALGVTLKF